MSQMTTVCTTRKGSDVVGWSDYATIRLQRCREPLPDTSLLYMKVSGARTVEPLELEVAQQIPDICSRHGLPASTQRPLRVHFYDTSKHPRSPRFGPVKWYDKRPSPVSTILVGSWPYCDRCLRTDRRGRRAAMVPITVMAVNLLAFLLVVAAGWLGLWLDELRPFVIPLALGVFPGSIPIGAAVAVWLFRMGTESAACFFPIDDERFVRVEAHPGFCAAIETAR